MAALSIGNFSLRKSSWKSQEVMRSQRSPRVLFFVCCHDSHDPVQEDTSGTKVKKEKKERKLLSSQILIGFDKFGKELKENLSPQKKGDWKDLVLMSLSFAVYVYISQQIVCAYFAWTSMPNPSW